MVPKREKRVSGYVTGIYVTESTGGSGTYYTGGSGIYVGGSGGYVTGGSGVRG